MATDGVKIIDGDLAFDTYSTFFEMYNKGASIETLIGKYEEDKCAYAHELLAEDYEICITAYALAFWEIGALTADMFKEVEAVIAKQATVKDWAEQIGAHAGKARQRELDKFLEKISAPRARPKARKNKFKGLSENEQTLLENATQLLEQGKYEETQQICEQLLLENPDCHKARQLLIESLLYPYRCLHKRRVTDCTATAVEEHCKYMLNNRDVDRNELSQQKKRKIYYSWYSDIYISLHIVLREQRQYDKLLKYTKDYMDFLLSAITPNKDNDYLFRDEFDTMYRCCRFLNDTQGIEELKEQYKAVFPNANLERDFASFEEYLESWYTT
jgi:hypothetical protein